MGIFSNQYVNQANQQSPKNMLLAQYRVARTELIMVLVLTAVNVLSLIFNSSFYFLFSLTVPYLSVGYGVAFTSEYGLPAFMIAGIVFAALIVGVYIVLYVLSKKKAGCLTAILVLFGIDTVAVIFLAVIEGSEGGFSAILDVLIHALVMFYFIRGVVAAKKLKALGVSVDAQPAPNAVNNAPAGETAEQTQPETAEIAPEENANKTVCPYCGSELETGASFCQSCGAKLEPEEQAKEQDEGPADQPEPDIAGPEYKTEPVGAWDGQGKIRLAAIYNGVEVKAVRKFSCTELIVDGKVYDTFDKIIEGNYTLAAEVNGVKYIYAQDGFGEAALTADGMNLASGTFAF